MEVIPRESGQVRSHIFVEPGRESKILLGTVAVTAPQQALVFNLSPGNRLGFAIRDQDILLLELSIATLTGVEVLRITDNHIRHNERPDIEFQQVPGTVNVVAPATEEFVPAWAVQQMRIQEPSFGDTGTITLLAMLVLKPGLVRVQGVWAQQDNVVVVTERCLSFLRPDLKRPLSMLGAGEASVICYAASGRLSRPVVRLR